MSDPIRLLSERLKSTDDLRRLGQALWMLIDTKIHCEELFWARSLLGPEGDSILWQSLQMAQVICLPNTRVNPIALTNLLAILSGPSFNTYLQARLVWTLPSDVGLVGKQNSYLDAANHLISSATSDLALVSPFLEAKGIGHLLEQLRKALHRGVNISIITHGAESHSSHSSVALEALFKESKGFTGVLSVYSPVETFRLLIHSKIIVADSLTALLGSANITANGMGFNFEAGVVLGPSAAQEAQFTINALLKSGILIRNFCTASSTL